MGNITEGRLPTSLTVPPGIAPPSIPPVESVLERPRFLLALRGPPGAVIVGISASGMVAADCRTRGTIRG
jgi:hypothetical protein